jgi:hypothetical protein
MVISMPTVTLKWMSWWTMSSPQQQMPPLVVDAGSQQSNPKPDEAGVASKPDQRNAIKQISVPLPRLSSFKIMLT